MPPPDTYSDAIVARFKSPNKLIVRPGSTIELTSTATSVEKNTNRPEEFRLEQNYPNPFNPSTTISYELPGVGKQYRATIQIVDQLGRTIAVLVNGQKSGGRYTVPWNAAGFASGIYYCELKVYNLTEAQTYYAVRKILLVK
jgi:hypothetical protein